MQVASSLGVTSHVPPQAAPQRWRKEWHSESDYPDRRQLIQHIFHLLTQRKPNVTQEWKEKLPDFVKRLEEALYQGAGSKEEYVNTNTLEQRLQNVARTFVSSRGPRQQSQTPSRPGSAGLPQMPHGPVKVQQSPTQSRNQLDLTSPTVGQTDANIASMGLNTQQQQQLQQQQLQQQQQGMMRPQAAPSANGPVMSNGKPALLRGAAARDNGAWAQGPSMSVPTSQPNSRMFMPNGMANGQMGQMPATMAEPRSGPVQASQALRVPNGMMGGNNGMMGGNNGMVPMANGQNPHMPGMVPIMQSPQLPNMQGNGMVPVNNMSMSNGSSMTSVGVNGSASPSITGGNVIPQLPELPSSGLPGAAGPQGQYALNPPADGSGSGDQQDPAFQAKQRQKKQEFILKQQRWLLFLRHCAKCQYPDGQCNYGSSCAVAKQLWQHILGCSDARCEYPRCVASRELLKHHQKCSSLQCSICVPVKQHVQQQRLAAAQRNMPTQQQQQEMLARQRQQLQHERMHTQNQLTAESGMQPGMPPQMMNGMHPQQMHAGLQSMMQPNRGMPQRPREGPEGEPAPKRPRVNLGSNQGTSLLEAFNADEIKTHLTMLRSRPGQPHLAPIDNSDENMCKACGDKRLTFEPPSLYCTCCGQRIKRNQVYYTTPVNKTEVKGFWCHPCYQDHRGERIELDGTNLQVRKSELEKRKNDDEQEEGWVQCDACCAWVHMICGMFNKGRNDDEMPYHCPNCLMTGLMRGERQPIQVRPQAMLEARDLPKCDISDFLQERIDSALSAELIQRSKQEGVPPDQLVTAKGLTIRVINNVSKRMEVKPRFHEAFQKEGCPDAFPYRQKVILLFQRMDGVDVCLYCLYMQEYGDDCPAANRKWVYLSYLDSVKYFRPEIEAAGRNGMALRTLVYHEIMTGYLKYIKLQGFTSMFIWACPPLQGDDYILYCHPNRQKTPRSDRLREWYHMLLRSAKAEGTVTYLSNLFDTFFEGGKDHRVDKPSVLHLPYFEGDYWPGEAENLLGNISEEQRQAGRKGNKGSLTAGGKPRAKSAKGKRYGSGSVDEQVMGRLGEVIQGMKDDFIVVHLQEPCSLCREYISDAARYYHPHPPQRAVKSERTFEGISLDTPGQSSRQVLQMSRFQLCSTCYQRESSPSSGYGSSKARGLPGGMKVEDLLVAKVEPIPSVSDRNPDVECEFFHTRQAFLSLCQGNHYQFDTIRRAKHSSAMVLYHLHNPDAPAFASTCNACGLEIEAGHGFRCPQCTDYDLCAVCHNTGRGQHIHPLVAQVRGINELKTRLTESERHERQQQLQRTMTLLVHASACDNQACPSTNCNKVKALFKHAVACQQKVQGGCHLCRRMWGLLQLHAKQCQSSDCPVPRCRELREMRRRQMSRQEDQRRHAYQAMLRQQAQARKQQQQPQSQSGQFPERSHTPGY
ncbi:hypothetical protein WJX82_004140 [Trebouxia sp. C0006]